MPIDTDILLRHLINDIPEQAAKAADIIAEGAEAYPEVIPEAVYVLHKIYGIGREEVSRALLWAMDGIAVERRGQISEALMLFGSTKLDYIDCLLLAGFTSAGNDFISFDRKLMNRKRQTR